MRLPLKLVATLLVLLIAIPLFFRAQAFRRERQSNRVTAPETGRFVRGGDVGMFIQEAGNPRDPAVLLMHGTGAWSETWRRTLDTLAAARYYAVAIDSPPFGYSDRPASRSYTREAQARRILGVMDSLGLEQAVFVGHSFGARATLTAALMAPERVAKLVLVNAALGLSEDAVRAPRSRDPLPPAPEPGLLPRLMENGPFREILISATAANPALSRTLIQKFVYDPRSVTDEIVAVYQQPMTLEGTTPAVAAWARDFLASDDRELLRAIHEVGEKSLRTSVIWGELDAVTPLWQGEALRKLIPLSTLRTIPGIGHIPHLEAPNAFNPVLIEELR